MNQLFESIILNPIRNSITDFADRNAFCVAGQFYTYREFGIAVEHFRNEFRMISESIRCIEIRDDLDTYAKIVALWFEGKSYVPLHPFQPKERNEKIIAQIEEGEQGSFSDDLAYVLFTSGSTGTPKGVAISQKNIASFLDSFWKTGIVVTAEDKCMQCFDLTFDVSVQSFLLALTRGACVYTVPYGQVKYLYAASLIHEHKVTIGAMAPSMLTYLKPYFPELDASAMRTTILTAEACPEDLVAEWRRCAKNTTIYDFYGPTEATVYCSFYQIPNDKPALTYNGILSIGKPMANVGVIIIDEEGKELGNGQKGELCVSGDQVTQGYWNNKEKNAVSFFDKLVDGRMQRFYRTGDLCFVDDSGNMMYVGRIDQQAKIQGFRVELGEIEYHTREFYDQQVRAVSIAYANKSNLTEIALFVESKEIDKEALVSYLRMKMPSYMIPARIVPVESFPLNNSDKIDRNKLKSLL